MAPPTIPTIAILWVKYNRDITTLFSLYFKDRGYRVHIAHTAGDFINHCLSEPPTIVIIQRTIAQQDDGLSLCQEIRSIDALRQIPIIIGYFDTPSSDIDKGIRMMQLYDINGRFGRMFDLEGIHQMIEQLRTDPALCGLQDQYLKQRPLKSPRKTDT